MLVTTPCAPTLSASRVHVLVQAQACTFAAARPTQRIQSQMQRFRGRTSADNVCGVLDLLGQSKRSAALKAHSLLAQAQLARAVRRRRHLLTETTRDAAHISQRYL